MSFKVYARSHPYVAPSVLILTIYFTIPTIKWVMRNKYLLSVTIKNSKDFKIFYSNWYWFKDIIMAVAISCKSCWYKNV